MLHIPVNSIIAAPASWRNALGLPTATSEDWKIIAEMEAIRPGTENTTAFYSHAGRFSFYSYLLDRLLREAELYTEYKADSMLLENIAAPYFVRGNQPVVIYAVISALACELRQEYPDNSFGIQILAFSDDLAMEIAVRNRFSFIRVESVLFEGTRPEGRTPNRGNLARLYMRRNMLTASEEEYDGPLVLVDIQKKTHGI